MTLLVDKVIPLMEDCQKETHSNLSNDISAKVSITVTYSVYNLLLIYLSKNRRLVKQITL